ncbi:MAG TPA: polysulfide reductase NrfD [Thermoanaerobaculia bacterium]|nr:polysulfide reductase NrfD [Thermoanaerobaculia bacterium]
MTPTLLETVTTRANPGIDPALHVWGWEITAYLFLGGIVAGIFVLVAGLALASGEGLRSRVLRPMPLVALGLLSAGMLALWLDLAHRLWAWRFYATVRPTSPMSWGAWILVLIYPAGLLFFLGSLDGTGRAALTARAPVPLRRLLARLTEWSDRFRRPVLLVSVAMGAGLGLYTGLLLGTMPSRLLWNSAVLGPLFLASGLSTGAAFLLLFPLDEAERKTLVRWDVLAIAAELVLVALFLVGLATSGEPGRAAAGLLLGGTYTAVFWSLVVVTGLLVPLAMELLESRRHLPFVALTPVLILAGGLALRWVLLVAGQASAFRMLP